MRPGSLLKKQVLSDLTLTKANWNSKSIKVLDLGNVLLKTDSWKLRGQDMGSKKFDRAPMALGSVAVSEYAGWESPGTRGAEIP